MRKALATTLEQRTRVERSPRAAMAVSVIVPVSERPGSLVELYREYSPPLRESGRSFEFIFFVEPWLRDLAAPLSELAGRGEPIRVFYAQQGLGESTLIRLAVEQCSGEVIVTLPAYRRVHASAIIDLVARVQEGGADLAVARRWPRRDSWLNRLQTRSFHVLLRWLVGGELHDIACGVRAMRRESMLDLPLHGDFFRFLPVFAQREGYRVEEISSVQHDKDMPTRVYSPGVYLRRLVDLLGLFFLVRFTEKPLRFFGMIGSVMALAGSGVLVVLLVQRLGGQGIADRPMLLLGVLLVVLGVQAIALGLIGEIIVHLNAARRAPYRLLDRPRER